MENMNSQSVVKNSKSNFASSFRFLSGEKRDALDSIYAYCRITDDLVDLAPTPEEAKQKLDAWRKETLKAFKESTDDPVLRELAETVRIFHIPQEYFQQLLEGVRMDLEIKVYGTFEELYTYCYKVASVVGLMCIEVFGYKDPKTKEYAVNLGVAFQITNILRDIRSDSGRGRIYVPAEDLYKFALKSEDLLTLSGSSSDIKPEKAKQLRELVNFECKRAEFYYRKAKECLDTKDRSNLVAAEVMSAVYRAILVKIKNDPMAVFESKVRLGKCEKYLRVLQGWLVNRFRV